MKTEYNAVISKLEKEIRHVDDDREYRASNKHGVGKSLKLGEVFDGRILADSRVIIGLIFPLNFTFSENKIRTIRVNEIIDLFGKQYVTGKKKGQKIIFFFCPE
jgi:hypothetical protein